MREHVVIEADVGVLYYRGLQSFPLRVPNVLYYRDRKKIAIVHRICDVQYQVTYVGV